MPSSPASCATSCRQPATTCRSTGPTPGGFITEYYGHPARGVQCLQLEINRALYLDETTLLKGKDFDKLASALADMAKKVFAALPLLFERRQAAE